MNIFKKLFGKKVKKEEEKKPEPWYNDTKDSVNGLGAPLENAAFTPSGSQIDFAATQTMTQSTFGH